MNPLEISAWIVGALIILYVARSLWLYLRPAGKKAKPREVWRQVNPTYEIIQHEGKPINVKVTNEKYTQINGVYEVGGKVRFGDQLWERIE